MTQPSQWPEQPDPTAPLPPPQPAQSPPPQPLFPEAGPTQPLYPGAPYGASSYSYPQQYPPPPWYGGYPAQPPATNGLSIAAMVVGLVGALGLLCYGVGGYIGAVGAVLGHVARSQIRRSQESGDGMAIAGIVVGWIATGLALIATAVWIWLIVVLAEQPGIFDQLDNPQSF